MNRLLLCFLVISLVNLGLAVSASASKPVTQTLEGCVIKGVFYSVEKGVVTKSGPRIQVYRIETVKRDLSPYDVSPYEGKKIRVHGALYPGDRFIPDPKTLQILGPCDGESRDAISKSGD